MMNRLKRYISITVISILLLASIQPTVYAFENNESRSITNFFIETQLLKGDGSNYSLDKETTRMEAVIVLIRLMGKEADAQTLKDRPCKFKDVPKWAVGYANYAETNHISEGIGNSLFGANDKITSQQFNTLLLRMIGYDDKKGDFLWNDAVGKAEKLRILPYAMASEYEKNARYTKKDLIETAFCYLEAYEKSGNTTLIDRLIQTGVVSDKTAEKFGLSVDGWDSIRTNYDENSYLNFELKDQFLNVTGTSENKEQKWLLVNIRDKKTGADKFNNVGGLGSDGKYHITLELGTLPKGEYYVDVYGNHEHYNTYYNIMYSSIILNKNENGYYFTASPIYGQNLRIYKGNEVEEQDRIMNLETRNDKKSVEKISALALDITEGKTSDYDKARAIHDWVTSNIYYDVNYLNDETDATNINSIDVLNNKVAVCSGYANLMKDLLTSIGIPCKNVYGYALGISENEDSWDDVYLKNREPNHVWNEAYVDGRWIIIDATWDSGNSFQGGGKVTNDGITTYHYFDSSMEFLSNTHETMPWIE